MGLSKEPNDVFVLTRSAAKRSDRPTIGEPIDRFPYLLIIINSNIQLIQSIDRDLRLKRITKTKL